VEEAMMVSPIDPAQSSVAQYIECAKRSMCAHEGISNPNPKSLRALPFAEYWGLLVDGKIRGFGELVFYANAFKNYADCPWHGGYDLSAICSHETMVHLNAIYVDPQYRKNTLSFAYLYVALARYACSKDALFGTALVSEANYHLVGMYEKIGAQKIGSLAHLPKVKEAGVDVTLYFFNISDILASRVTRRFEQLSGPRR
jgi:ribosomal protein S18 acetylase RimI-like enzyme